MDARMHIGEFSFGALRVDGSTYEQDVVIDYGQIRKRKKAPSKRFRDEFGHTPLSIEEKLPWKCHRLVIGTGVYGRLPVMKEVKREAERRHVELVIVQTVRPARDTVGGDYPLTSNQVLRCGSSHSIGNMGQGSQATSRGAHRRGRAARGCRGGSASRASFLSRYWSRASVSTTSAMQARHDVALAQRTRLSNRTGTKTGWWRDPAALLNLYRRL